MRILVVEDYKKLAGQIVDGLSKGGFAADFAPSLGEANDALDAATYDLVILDLGLPDGDGIAWLKSRREKGSSTPVLILTARDALGDRVKGLDSGGDDYLVKPFAMDELLARCRALLRRPSETGPTVLEADELVLDLATRSVRINDRPVELGRREVALLEVLLRRVDSVVTREVIEGQLYAFESEITPNAIEAAISRLRHKLEEAGSSAQIHTVRGVGYLLKAE